MINARHHHIYKFWRAIDAPKQLFHCQAWFRLRSSEKLWVSADFRGNRNLTRWTAISTFCSLTYIGIFRYIFSCFVSSKAKGRISKRVFQENKASQIFRKTNISYLSIDMGNLLCFLETPILRIAPFALLPTICLGRRQPFQGLSIFFSAANICLSL